jgi:acetyltransferase-like isoleucine patch superfamily enzyme
LLKKIISKILKYTDSDGRKNDFCSIGENSKIGKGFLLIGFDKGKISIGKYCDIAENFRVRPRNHSIKYANMQRNMHRENGFIDLSEYKGNVDIGHACWFGDNIEVLSGVKIGNGVVIGAGSIVTKDIPDYSIAVGVPAKVTKFRFQPEIIALMNEIAWWHWDKDTIARNQSFFELDLTLVSMAELKRVIK